ncbi:MAG: TAXI family TRAP transporter solute-binding subunit [Xanthobacteraceae bacterium]
MRTIYGRLVAALVGLVASFAVAQAETQLDPADVSAGLKAIFRYGSSTRQVVDRLNANTVTLMSGTIGGTYVQIGADLASVLDNGDDLRVLPIVGRGSVQSVADILFLKGVDLGIVRSDTLDYLENKGIARNIKGQFTYITKLYNEEMHVVARKSIRSVRDLDGKTVSVDLPNGGTFITSIIVFERLGIKANFVYIEQRIALDKLKKGEIDAVIAVQGKPSKATTQIDDDNLHLVPVEYAKPLQDDYLPATLDYEDYPKLIEKGQRVDTIAVPAVLAAYNWAPNTDRYRRLAHFVDVFFGKISDFQKPPFHPKWKELSLTASLRGWTRFKPAQDWLAQHTNAAAVPDVRNDFAKFLAAQGDRGDLSGDDREALFQQFLEWQKRH